MVSDIILSAEVRPFVVDGIVIRRILQCTVVVASAVRAIVHADLNGPRDIQMGNTDDLPRH